MYLYLCLYQSHLRPANQRLSGKQLGDLETRFVLETRFDLETGFDIWSCKKNFLTFESLRHCRHWPWFCFSSPSLTLKLKWSFPSWSLAAFFSDMPNVSISSTYPGRSLGWWHFQISLSLDPHGALVDHGILYIFWKLWIQIRIIFGFGKSCEYEYKYILFLKVIRKQIRILFGLKISVEYENEYHYLVSTVWILFKYRIIRSPLICIVFVNLCSIYFHLDFLTLSLVAC